MAGSLVRLILTPLNTLFFYLLLLPRVSSLCVMRETHILAKCPYVQGGDWLKLSSTIIEN